MRAVLAALLTIAPASAAAHQVPQVLSFVGFQGTDPVVTRHAYGLVARAAPSASWRFVCPEAWGRLPEVPVAQLGPAQNVVVVTSSGTVFLDLFGAMVSTPDPVLTSEDRPAVTSAAGRIYMIGSDHGGGHLFELDEALTELHADPTRPFHSVGAHQDHLYVASSSAGMAQVDVLSVDGIWIETMKVGVPFERLEILISDHAHLLIHEPDGGSALYALEEAPRLLLQVEQAIDGVATINGALHALVDGAIIEVASGAPLRFDASFGAATCLDEGAAGPYVCFYQDVYLVEADGTLGDKIFDQCSIKEPDYSVMSSEAAIECRNQWLDLALEARFETSGGGCRPPPQHRPPTPIPTPKANGCSCFSHATEHRARLTLLCLLVGVLLRRRRR